MFKTIAATIKRDPDYPARQNKIDVLTRVIDGTFYDNLQYDFHQEKIDTFGEYIPLRERRPSVRYALCKVVVDDSVSLLFSEGHFPAVECADETTRDTLTSIIKETKLNAVMIEAATVGSVGSVAILMRVLLNRVFFNALNTMFLTPVWKKDAPDKLDRVIEKYKVKGSDLRDRGYTVAEDDLNVSFWFQREWDDAAEIWYLPWKVKGDEQPAIDNKNTVQHGLGFVPVVWVKNLPGGDDIDGRCTFPPEAIDTQIEIDYQLSQGGRGLKYSSDPTLLIKEPALGSNGSIIKGGGNAIQVSADGDAKMLEINGTASEAVINYVRCLREMALESAHGNRASADKISAAQSGRAMELMNQSLVWLADKLRISYGEGALLDILKMIVQASNKYKLLVNGKSIEALTTKDGISLRWPQWYQPTYADKQTQAETLTTLRTTGLLSQETAVKSLAASYDIADPEDEQRQIESDPPVPAAQVSTKQPPLSDSED